MSGGGRGRLMADINVTPLVDVMLVLLIIFMVTSSVEKIDKQREKKKFNEKKKADLQRKVPIKLPKVNAKEVIDKEDKKLVLSFTLAQKYFIGETEIVACKDSRGKGTRANCDEEHVNFKACLKQLQDKLLENHKLQQDKEIYLRADRGLPYGCVLKTMQAVRAAGITKFGLVSDPEVEQPPSKGKK
ncbi:MAG: biopolymer transporter ExbD [Myxococcales bacterium]|nr:biopolymer transporter ExbD [Myxococcales bacterium]